MPNFKFLKRASILFVLAFVLFSHNVSLAQERINPRDSGMAVLIESAEIKTTEDGIEIEAVLSNPSSTVETPLAAYLLILENIDPLVKSKDLDYTPSSLIVSAQEGGDYFSLKPNEKKTVKYFLPVSQYLPIANYAFNLRFMQRSGNVVGQHREILRDFGFNRKKSSQGNYEKGFLAFFQESCVILNAKGEKFEPNEGPVFNPLEQPKARCMVKNIGDEDITVRPKIEWKEFFVYGRPSSGAKLEEKLPDIFIFKKGETKLVEVFLPMAQKPQVYQALLSFNDEAGDKRSFDMPFRWTIGGSSARVEEISLISPIKNIYNKGETMSLSVDYFGSMDLYWRNSSDELAGLSGLRMLAVVEDKNGEVCGQKEMDLPDINDSGRNNQVIDVVLDKKCENPSYSVSVSSNNEKLSEETAEVPKTTEAQINKIYYYIGALILFLALLVMTIKRRKKAIGTVAMLLFTFAAFGISFNSADASATKTYTGFANTSTGDYGGYANLNSDPLYSFYGVNDTSNVNKLVIKDVYVDLDTDLSGFYVDLSYASGYTSCSNSTMQIRYRMYVEAGGSQTRVNFANLGSSLDPSDYPSQQIKEYTSSSFGGKDASFVIAPSFLSNFYDSDKKLKTNPRLIIEIVQSGKSTHTNPYHRGDFSKPVSTVDFSSRSSAFDASDTIKYVIPLNLPNPSVNLTATPAKVAPPNDNVSVKLDTTDMTECKYRNSKNYSGISAFDSLTFDAPLENGTKSQKKDISHVWSPSVSTAVQNNELKMDCTRDLGKEIGKGIYSAKATIDVNSPNYKLKISKSPFSDAGVSGTVSVSLLWPATIAYSDDDIASTGSKMIAVASAVKNIFNRAEAFSRDSSKHLAVNGSFTCNISSGGSVTDSVNGGPCEYLIPETASVTLQASPLTATAFTKWDQTVPSTTCSNSSSNPCTFTMPKADTVVGVKLVSSTNSSTSSSGGGGGGGGGGGSSSSVASVSSSSVSSNPDPGTFNLTVIQTGSGSGSVSLKHMGSLDGNGGGLDSNIPGSSPWGLAKNWIYQITATPSSGSSLGGVSGGGCGNSPCTITMNSDKTVTVTFNSDTGCCGGGNDPTASISARENPVLDGATDIDWGSANASSCVQSGGGNDSADWENADDTISGSYYATGFSTSEGSRTYTINCTNGSQTASASVVVGVGGEFGDPSVDIWADDSSIKNKEKTTIRWSSSNIIRSECELYSATDSMAGYLKTNYDFFGAGYYNFSAPKNNTITGQKTGALTSDTTYKIMCVGKGWVKVSAQTTVTVAPPVSDFTFTNTTGNMTATIVEGLSANSSSVTLAFSGSAIGKVNLSASVPSKFGSGAKAQFSVDDGVNWSDAPLNNIDISVTSQVKLKVVNIPGNTATGTYTVKITAKDDKRAPFININLQVKKVTSEWQEF